MLRQKKAKIKYYIKIISSKRYKITFFGKKSFVSYLYYKLMKAKLNFQNFKLYII